MGRPNAEPVAAYELSPLVFNASGSPNTVAEPRPLFGLLNYALAHMAPEVLVRHLRRDLVRCGWGHPQQYENYLAFRNFTAAASAVGLAAWFLVLDDSPALRNWVVALGFLATIMVVGCIRVIVSARGENRVRKILQALPDGLDLVAMGMNSGLSFLNALQHASVELHSIHPELAYELELVQRQSASGSIEYALSRFGQRMDWAEIQPILNTLTHAIQSGTSLRSSLEDLADQARSERMRRLVQRANRNSILMLFPIILCLAPAALMLIFAPPIIKLRDFRKELESQRANMSRAIPPDRPRGQ